MRKLTLLVAYLWCVGILFAQSPMKIGDEIATKVSTGHPYNVSGTKGFIFEETFHNDNSSYIKLHFKNFQLQPGDYVEVFSPNTGESHIYAEGGKVVNFETRETISEFWSNIIWDEAVTVRLYSNGSSSHYGFDIDVAAYGYSEKKLESIYLQRSICSADNKEQIICYNGTEMYNKARSVCRLVVNGSILCTGWLLGSEGHVMTNNHCIGSSSAAQNTDFQFNYEYTNCNGSSAASTDVVASSSTFIKTSSSLDYTLVQLPVNPTSTYGYLSLSPTLPSVGDRIYIPQHPGGRRKEISVNTDDGVSSVNCIGNQGDCGNSGGPDKSINYYADTEGGSSGSPIIDYNNHLVLAIHNTGVCANGSYGHCVDLINAIGNDMPNNGIGDGSSPGTGSAIYNNGEVSITGSWSTVTFAEAMSQTPIVVVGPPSYAGGDPSTIRVRNVSSTGFEVQVKEWDYLDGNHNNAETVSYLAVVPGNHNFNGISAEAGSITVDENWVTESLSQFSSTPVILATQVTNSGSNATAIRLRNVGSSSFQAKLREEEANDDLHNLETVHYIALSTGSGTFNGKSINVGLTGTSVTHNWYTINFSGSYNDIGFLGNMQTHSGSDPSSLRYRNLSGTSVQVFVEEEKSLDDEINHNNAEAVGWLRIQNVSSESLDDNDVVFETETIEDTNTLSEQPVVSIYPNPAKDIIYFKHATDDFVFSVFDQAGKKVLESNGTRLQISGLKTGIYIINSNLGQFKFIKQ